MTDINQNSPDNRHNYNDPLPPGTEKEGEREREREREREIQIKLTCPAIPKILKITCTHNNKLD